MSIRDALTWTFIASYQSDFNGIWNVLSVLSQVNTRFFMTPVFSSWCSLLSALKINSVSWYGSASDLLAKPMKSGLFWSPALPYQCCCYSVTKLCLILWPPAAHQASCLSLHQNKYHTNEYSFIIVLVLLYYLYCDDLFWRATIRFITSLNSKDLVNA